MKPTFELTGESSNHKMAVVFETRDSAEKARNALAEETGLEASQMNVLDPDSEAANRSLLPESRGIWRTLVRSHVGLGLAGAVAGVALFLALNLADVPFVAGNPWAALLLAVHVLTMLGLMAGGLLTLRPDQVPYIRVAREALSDGRAVLVIHARSADELDTPRALLEQNAFEAIRAV